MDEIWYVRFEGTGEILGPMSKHEAYGRAEAADGVVFSSEIFEPPDISKVKEWIDSLRTADLLEAAAKALSNLFLQVANQEKTIAALLEANKVPATEEVEEVLAALGTLDSWTREDRNLGGYEKEIRIVVQRAQKALILLSREKSDVSGEVEELVGRLRKLACRLVEHLKAR